MPLGEGMLDLRAWSTSIRARGPRCYFSLEMITRDPLDVPCVTDKYWSTFGDVGGLALARALTRVRANVPRAPLPTIAGLSTEQRYALEVELVGRSFDYARDHLGLGA